jgi:hypothetical protein
VSVGGMWVCVRGGGVLRVGYGVCGVCGGESVYVSGLCVLGCACGGCGMCSM